MLFLITTILLGTLKININNNLIIYIFAFITILFTIFYSSLIYINIFKELENDGLEILTLSKPISRNKIYLGKSFYLILFSLVFAIALGLLNTLLLISLKLFSQILLYLGISVITYFLIFNFIGSIASLIAYKTNTKIAMTIPFIVSTPLMIGGTILNSYSTSISNNFNYYLNLKYQHNLSGKISNAEEFYLNNNQDNLFFVPNGYENDSFSKNQKDFFNEIYKLSANASKELNLYSWLAVPYQFLDIFNTSDKNIFNNNIKQNNLENVLFYKNNDSYLFNYKLKDKANLATKALFEVNDESVEKFIVPGALKNQTLRDGYSNTNIIYAREGASDFKQIFPEDKYVFAASDNLVGELKWEYIKEILENKDFQKYAQNFFEQFTKNQINDLNELKQQILTKLENQINDEQAFLNTYANNFVTAFNPIAIENKQIKTTTEKKIYLATAMLYYAYFSFNNSQIVQAILINPDLEKNYEQDKLTLLIGKFKYKIGGYSSYTPVQEVSTINDEQKVIIRYNLEESNNFLFQEVANVYELERSNLVVSKWGYIGLWTLITALLIAFNTYKYNKKDYK
ncbi:ABC-2 transporter permease [Mycoplasmopsis gallopavonis]|uniref:ABC transporter permease n=1 Tax=Mycoplasmopsis gallopavonis TaxID=76629 RepID=UPI00101C9EA4|nr:ABC transporter permease [Mycoplasmopsis gallopavonis]